MHGTRARADPDGVAQEVDRLFADVALGIRRDYRKRPYFRFIAITLDVKRTPEVLVLAPEVLVLAPEVVGTTVAGIEEVSNASILGWCGTVVAQEPVAHTPS